MNDLKACTVLLLAAAISPVFAGTTEPVVPSEKTVKLNEQFSFDLPSNPTTGYGWIVRHLPSQVALTGMEYKQSPDCNGMMGCGGIETLYFKAVKVGQGKVALQYARPFEKLDDKPDMVIINVTE